MYDVHHKACCIYIPICAGQMSPLALDRKLELMRWIQVKKKKPYSLFKLITQYSFHLGIDKRYTLKNEGMKI